MGYLPGRGDCILIPFNEVKHLFFVLNSPCKDGLCLLTMLTSRKANRFSDDACLFLGGEHGFIKHSSYVVYSLANFSKASHIANMVDKGLYQVVDPATPEVLARVIAGLFESDETKQAMVNYARSVGLQ